MSTIEQTVGELLDEQDWTAVFSDGWVDAPETIATVEPATGEVLGTAGLANAASVAAAAKSAARAQRAWAALPMARSRCGHQPRGGAPRPAPGGDHHVDGARVRGDPAEGGARDRRVDRTAERGCIPDLGVARAGAGVADPRADVDCASRADRRRRRDHAVELPARAGDAVLGPALVLGNAVVLKSDPNTPVTGGVVIARIFEEAGLPSGVLHVLCGGPEVGQALVEDPNVRMISFTGSTTVIGGIVSAKLRAAA